jgi:hypothetical protein
VSANALIVVVGFLLLIVSAILLLRLGTCETLGVAHLT